ncbi:MAG: hypothetical protein JKY60_14600 [Kordiimonadaceae bacterium]|nr:hypothetical protein [Kordiimonadaceae bacterium]
MIIQILFVFGALPLAALGTMHLVFTLKDNQRPRYIVPVSGAMITQMKNEKLRLTREGDMWRAWIGFNVSHSMAVMMVGWGYLYIALRYPEVLTADPIILWAAPFLASVFALLSKRFWFSKPLIGSLLSAAFFSAGAVVAAL